MLDVLSKVKQSEESAQQILNDAQQKTVVIRADAQKQGKANLDNAKSEALKQAEKLVAKARLDAGARLDDSKVASENECKAMAEKSEQKLAAAASLIVERIVNTL